MNQLGTVYATKRRRRNGKSLKPPPKDGVTKSNPSKRHRERLNAELDTLASLLPFEQNILSKLDRLSILRLSVSYLRTKSYFQVAMQKDQEDRLHHDSQFRNRDLTSYEHSLLDGEMFLQALNGFLLILTCEGEVFFATHSIESYLGFHQSDIVHQSVYELVHSEDREELQRQLMWNSFLPPESANITLQEVLQPANCHLLERSFTVRFRCLLDNTSGFLRLDIRGRIKVLHGQNRKTEEPPLALFALCTPFGPPSLLEIPQKEVMFKSKHKLDFSLVSMDQRGKMLLGYSDAELTNMGGYDLVHYDDLAYVASAHQELLKTGASGMIAYRLQTKEGQWQWLQTSSRLVYKNSKPDFIISTHRPLMEEEGRDLLGKRTMDFKVSYLDAGLTNSYFNDSEPATQPAQRVNRRYKTHMRDFLSTCRTKRKLGTEYLNDNTYAAAAAATNFNNMYTATAVAAAAAYPTDNGLYGIQQNLQNFQNLYPAIDNRFLPADNLFQPYRLSSYYSDYSHHTATASPYGVGNGFLDVPSRTCLPTYDTSQLAKSTVTTDNKLYPCQLNDGSNKAYAQCDNGQKLCDTYTVPSDHRNNILGDNSVDIKPVLDGSDGSVQCDKKLDSHGMRVVNNVNGLTTQKVEDIKSAEAFQSTSQSQQQQQQQQRQSSLMSNYTNDTRQTVLMWGSGRTSSVELSPATQHGDPNVANSATTSSTLHSHYTTVDSKKYTSGGNGTVAAPTASDPLKSLVEMNSLTGATCKWDCSTVPLTKPTSTSPLATSTSLQVTPKASGYVPYTENGSEVWNHQYYSYNPYHHTPHSATDSYYPSISRSGVLCCPSLK